jgi:hypothetical protein
MGLGKTLYEFNQIYASYTDLFGKKQHQTYLLVQFMKDWI